MSDAFPSMFIPTPPLHPSGVVLWPVLGVPQKNHLKERRIMVCVLFRVLWKIFIPSARWSRIYCSADRRNFRHASFQLWITALVARWISNVTWQIQWCNSARQCARCRWRPPPRVNCDERSWSGHHQKSREWPLKAIRLGQMMKFAFSVVVWLVLHLFC